MYVREVLASSHAGADGVRDCFRGSSSRLAVARRVATVGRYSAENHRRFVDLEIRPQKVRGP